MGLFPSILESITDLNLTQINSLLSLAKHYKDNKDSPPYFQYKRPIVATSFLEHSTRTKNSFTIALNKLGCIHNDFDVHNSSLKKGENLEETLLTLHYQGVDLCIIRTPHSHHFSDFKNSPPIKIINGGDGINEHPTQALLDLFTMIELHGSLKGKKIGIVGDVFHSRVTHSLIKLLPLFGAEIILCGPDIFMTKEDTQLIKQTQNLDDLIQNCDILYLLRIQKERHQAHYDFDKYHSEYGLSLDRLKKHQKFPPLYHPGPANIGMEISLDVMKSNLYKGYEQVIHSIPMRMSIIQHILTNSDKNIGIIHGEKF